MIFTSRWLMDVECGCFCKIADADGADGLHQPPAVTSAVKTDSLGENSRRQTDDNIDDINQ